MIYLALSLMNIESESESKSERESIDIENVEGWRRGYERWPTKDFAYKTCELNYRNDVTYVSYLLP